MEVTLLVLETALKLKKAAGRLFREFELSPAQFNVLNLLAEEAAGMRAGDLANALIVDPSNITGLLNRMTADGLLEECASPDDARRRVVKLTTKGRARWQKAHAAYASALREFEAALSANERGTAQRALEKIRRKCDERLD